jgi:hypothetical protein
LNVRGIIWIEEFVEKLVRKHGVARDEVREVLRDGCVDGPTTRANRRAG